MSKFGVSQEKERALEARLRRAASRVCAKDGSIVIPEMPCTRPTMAHALAQLDRTIARWRSNDFAGTASITVRAR